MGNVGFKILLLLNLAVFMNCDANTPNSSDVINGKALFDMGVKYDKPLLRMFGKSLKEHECREHPCSQWTAWSECDEYVGQYGMKSRRRECGTNINCGPDQNPRNETVFTTCQEFCPDDYKTTADGFCFKYYRSSRTKAVAEQTCKTDGGYLVNINSALKWKAFNALMTDNSYTSYVYIDGERKDVSSQWTFSYGTDFEPYSNWYTGQPTNSSSYLCRRGRKDYGMYSVSCATSSYFVCEMIPSF